MTGLEALAETFEVHFDGEDGSKLSIIIFGYSYPQSEDYWDGNWIRVDVNVRITGFSGNMSGHIRLEELQDLVTILQHIHGNLSGTAIFSTTEEWIGFEIKIGKLGEVHIRGFLQDYWSQHNVLSFVIRSDQTYLLSPIKQLKAILTRFPIRGTP